MENKAAHLLTLIVTLLIIGTAGNKIDIFDFMFTYAICYVFVISVMWVCSKTWQLLSSFYPKKREVKLHGEKAS